MDHQLLVAIYEIGGKMHGALQAGDTDTFYDLVHRRGQLLNQLSESPAPVKTTPEREQMASALAEQHKMLNAALAEHEQQLTDAMGSLQRYRGARMSYGKTAPSGGSILRENVSG